MWSRIRGREDGDWRGPWPPCAANTMEESPPRVLLTPAEDPGGGGACVPSCGIMCVPCAGPPGDQAHTRSVLPAQRGQQSLYRRSGATQPSARSALNRQVPTRCSPNPPWFSPPKPHWTLPISGLFRPFGTSDSQYSIPAGSWNNAGSGRQVALPPLRTLQLSGLWECLWILRCSGSPTPWTTQLWLLLGHSPWIFSSSGTLACLTSQPSGFHSLGILGRRACRTSLCSPRDTPENLERVQAGWRGPSSTRTLTWDSDLNQPSPPPSGPPADTSFHRGRHRMGPTLSILSIKSWGKEGSRQRDTTSSQACLGLEALG